MQDKEEIKNQNVNIKMEEKDEDRSRRGLLPE
jgi:hypothetical protein